MNLNQKIICVLFGGMSSEHEISLLSAASIIKNLNRETYQILPVGITKKGQWLYAPDATPASIADGSWQALASNVPATLSADRKMRGLILFGKSPTVRHVDCVFPALHGKYGEDGCVQGLLELSGIPYVSPGVSASAVAMDKTLTKLVVRELGIRQADWLVLRAADFDSDPSAEIARIEARFSYPVFVKPANTGSSVGINKAKNRDGLQFALEEASRYDDKLLVEECIEGLEIETAVLGNREPRVSQCGQILPAREFYCYESKYFDKASKTLIPAELTAEEDQEIRAAAARIYQALDCRCLSRVDFFVTRGAAPAVVFNEINTIPGFTDISMYAKLFDAEGIPYPPLLDRLIACAFDARSDA